MVDDSAGLFLLVVVADGEDCVAAEEGDVRVDRTAGGPDAPRLF